MALPVGAEAGHELVPISNGQCSLLRKCRNILFGTFMKFLASGMHVPLALWSSGLVLESPMLLGPEPAGSACSSRARPFMADDKLPIVVPHLSQFVASSSLKDSAGTGKLMVCVVGRHGRAGGGSFRTRKVDLGGTNMHQDLNLSFWWWDLYQWEVGLTSAIAGIHLS